MIRLFVTLLFIFSFGLPVAKATFLPENEILFAPFAAGPSNMTETEFNAIISKIDQIYSPVVKQLGGRLSLKGQWSSERLNAGARQMFGSWQVQITGGLARHPELSQDAFALIICHELGHHIAGFPFAEPSMPLEGKWAASEGQADYFSTQVCARRLWKDELNLNTQFRFKVNEQIRFQCDRLWKNKSDQNLCYRILSASQSMTRTMAAIKGQAAPDFATPDKTRVETSLSSHPPIQCRMDTVLKGALCKASFNESLIPGKKTPGGRFGIEAEKEAAMNSCTQLSQHQE
ncbi:MAG: hypothetical protein ACK5V3_10590, partial [Bdellovibrionales bacterium]